MDRSMTIDRRRFLAAAGAASAGLLAGCASGAGAAGARRTPNVVFVLADQWRAQACGYTGDHIRLHITFTVCALLLAHSLRPNRSSRLGKERS